MGVTEGTQRREEGKRKHVEPQHNTPRLRKACAQLRLEGATAAFWRILELYCSLRGARFCGFPGGSHMLSSGRMEEFVTEEEEPWYDQQDLEQGKTRHHPPCPQHPHCQLLAPAGQLAST